MRATHLSRSEQWCTDEQADDFADMAISAYRQDEHRPRLDVTVARYGGKGTWADVTDIVQQLVSYDSINFTVSNDIIGGDPLVKVVKRLNID